MQTGAETPKYDAALTAQFSELIFGIVRPVGVDRDRFSNSLEQCLRDFGYEVKTIHLSTILSDTYIQDQDRFQELSEADRVGKLIDAGDSLCERSDTAAAVALCGVSEIHTLRPSDHSDPGRRAFIIDSIKRVEEVYQLKNIYGDRYFQFGLQSSLDNRRQFLRNKEKGVTFSKGDGEIDAAVDMIMDRDLRETSKFGQNTMRAFPMSDIFVDMDIEPEMQVRRFMNLLFGSPDYEVPTEEEFGMQLAYISSTRSPELGLKVGAAILASDQRVIAIGVNAHPEIKDQSPDFDVSASDIGRLVLDTAQALAADYFTGDRQRELQEDPDAFTRQLLSGALESAKIRDLTEFQPTVHAEMSALLDAIRTQSSLTNVTMYVTAYPCHGCAKHLVDLGLPVVYLEPYPKSRAAVMYGDSVERNFRTFSGIAPNRYQALFSVKGDRKQNDGTRRRWEKNNWIESEPNVRSTDTVTVVNEREVTAISNLPDPDDFHIS